MRLAQRGLPGRFLGHLIEVHFLDRAVILAAQAFSAILPLFIVVSTISPHPGGDSPTTVLVGKLGLDGAELSSLRTSVVPPASARASIDSLGVVLALLTATSFARALQRSYQLAWRLPPVGLRAAWRPLALVVGLALYIELLYLFGRLVRGVPAGSVLEDLVTFAGAWALWTGAGSSWWPRSSVPSWQRTLAASAGSSGNRRAEVRRRPDRGQQARWALGTGQVPKRWTSNPCRRPRSLTVSDC